MSRRRRNLSASEGRAARRAPTERRRLRREAESESATLREAINAYATGFRKDPAHYYSGINAVTLLHLLAHLSDDDLKVRMEMEGGVRWAIRGALERNPKDYWARISLAELEVLVRAKPAVDAATRPTGVGPVTMSGRQLPRL